MMRLAMRLPASKGDKRAKPSDDPRQSESAEIIDLASRNGFPSVAQRKPRSDAAGLALGIALVAGLGLVAFWGMNSARLAPPPASDGPQNAAREAASKPAAIPLATAPIGDPKAKPSPVRAPAYTRSPSTRRVPAINPYASPTVMFDSSAAPALPSTASAPQAVAPAPNGAGIGASANDFASRIGGVGGAAARARAMVNPTTTVTQGTLIPAVLETAINTDVPGYVRAIVSKDVRSFDGTRVLVPRSSRLIGQYQSGVQGGQKRAYVIWTRLIRPDGASVNLASPAIGFDGTTGLQGKVNSHFFKRFGSAMLLSVIGGLSTIGSGGTSLVLGAGGQSAAATAAQQDSQIGPTIRVRLGAPIRVFTARDLDFSRVD